MISLSDLETAQWTALSFSAGAAAAALARWWWILRARRRGLPVHMQNARLVMSEQAIATTAPVPMHGKPDEVYCFRRVLIPLETKTRKRIEVRASDVVQLSVYAVILRHMQDPHGLLPTRRIAKEGWLRIVTPKETVFRPVKLLSEEDVVLLWHHYHAIRAGEQEPERAIHPGICRHCGHAGRCPKRWG